VQRTGNAKLTIEGLSMYVLYTPGHTDDSYSFLMGDRVFTGDTPPYFPTMRLKLVHGTLLSG
jgi:hypothetical protein